MTRPLVVIALLQALALMGCGGERREALMLLKSPQPRMRISGLRTLAEMRDVSAVGHIAPLTRDPLPRVRRAALTALGVVGVGNKLGAVMARLEDPDIAVRLSAVQVLGASRRKAAQRVLLETLRDSNMVVRKAAERALKGMGLSRKAQRKAQAAKRLQVDIVRSGARDAQVRATACRDLGASGRQEAEGALVARATDPSALVLGEAALALAALNTPRADAAITQMAGSKDVAARIAAARGLARVGRLKELVSLARDGEPSVRRAVLEAAAGQKSKSKAPDTLLKLACTTLLAPEQENADGALRVAAARILRDESEGCGEALEQRLSSFHGGAKGLQGDIAGVLLRRCRIAAALGRTSVQVTLTAALYALHRDDAKRWVSPAQWRALDRKDAVEKGAKPKGKPKGPQQRQEALRWLLWRYNTERPSLDLADLLLPPMVARRVVHAAIDALPLEVEALPLLTEIATRGPRGLRIAALSRLAAFPLGRAGAPAAMAIGHGLSADDEGVLLASMRACQHLGTGAVPRALEWLRSGRFQRREAAAICVARLKTKAAVPALMESLAEDAQVAVVQALALIGDKRAMYAIARLLNEDHRASRQGDRVAIVEALEVMGDVGAAKYLVRELSDPRWQVRQAAAQALTRLRFSGAAAELDVCTEDYFLVVRESCRGALERIRKKK
ncbi:MAG: HEAT repeat domain-containing protein [Deltaproteobacteria bacterium]|nr:HEAT repeat domain-containing protein [Deltaproteobacteria bacterium]